MKDIGDFNIRPHATSFYTPLLHPFKVQGEIRFKFSFKILKFSDSLRRETSQPASHLQGIPTFQHSNITTLQHYNITTLQHYNITKQGAPRP